MAQGQLTYLQLVNRVLLRLGKSQIAQASFAAATGDSWGGIIKDTINDAQQEIYKEHDWSTLQTSADIVTSSRTFDMSDTTPTPPTDDVSNFGREVDLVDVTNNRVLTPVNARDIDEFDPALDDAGAPSSYAIDYPNLLFDMTPDDITFRLRYFKRPTALTDYDDTSILPEFCDMAMVWWAVWQMQASREDAQDGGENARTIYQGILARAIGQDRRRMDQMLILQPVFAGGARSIVPFPSNYPAE